MFRVVGVAFPCDGAAALSRQAIAKPWLLRGASLTKAAMNHGNKTGVMIQLHQRQECGQQSKDRALNGFAAMLARLSVAQELGSTFEKYPRGWKIDRALDYAFLLGATCSLPLQDKG